MPGTSLCTNACPIKGYTLTSFVVIFTLTTLLFLTATSQDIFEPPAIVVPDRPNVIYYKPRSNVSSLECHSQRGIPTPTYEWWKDGSKLDKGVDSVTGTLVLRETTHLDEGVYECRAFNEIGRDKVVSVSSPQTLRQFLIDIVEGETVTVTATEYGHATLQCRIEGEIVSNPDDLKFNWFKAGDQIPTKGDDGRRYISNNGNLHFVYTLSSDGLNDPDTYKCGVTTTDYTKFDLFSPTKLVVKSSTAVALKPTLISSTKNVQVLHGSSAKLECVFSGYQLATSGSQLPTVKWFDYADNEITSRSGDNDKYVLSELNRVLTVNHVTLNDEHEYTCQGKTTAGYSPKEKVYLNVTSVPIFNDPPKYVTAIQGDNAVINCDARSLGNEAPPGPPAWTLNGEPISKSKPGRDNILFLRGEKTLTVLKTSKPSDIMCVECVVKNSVGQTIGSACVNVILPLIVKVQCEKCKNSRPEDCSCTEWEISHGENIEIRVTTTTDPAYVDKLTREWLINDQLVPSRRLPPHMTFDKVMDSYQLNTSLLTEQQFAEIGGEYVLKISHEFDAKNVTLTVTLKGLPVPATSSAGFDMWIVGLIIGLVFLLIIIIIIIVACVNRKKQEGVYNLGKKETNAGYNAKTELEKKTFSDLSRPEQDDMNDYGDYPEENIKGSREILFRERVMDDTNNDDAVFDYDV